MLFEGGKELNEFYDEFGGQRYHGICTPRNKPYIYLIYSPKSSHSKYGSIDDVISGPDDRPTYLRYAFEGDGELKNGNLAVLNHDNSENGIYKSLLLFYLENGMIWQIGEYKRINLDELAPEEYRSQAAKNHLYGETEDGKKFFLLERVTDLDDVKLRLVVPSEIESNEVYIERIGSRRDYDLKSNNNYLEGSIRELGRGYSGYDFIDENNNVVDIEGASDEARKARQYLYMIMLLHKELKENNIIYRDKIINGKTKKEYVRMYSPELQPKIKYSEAYFYVVNVGWGLCQFLVFKDNDGKKEVWAFDCGRQEGGYDDNIKACLKEIYGENATAFRLDKIFISHPHDDHFDGYSLFDLDENTEAWINPNIRFCANEYYKFLVELCRKKCKVVEPFVRNSGIGGLLNIKHPDGHIVLDKQGSRLVNFSPISYASSVRRKTLYKVTEDKMNELSPLIELKVFDKSIIITGDIMGRGWTRYKKANTCIAPNVYVHSHHGTSSGFKINRKETEYSFFDPIVHEFVSINNSYRATWKIDSTLEKKTSIYRTDEGAVKYYRYDIKNNIVDSVT